MYLVVIVFVTIWKVSLVSGGGQDIRCIPLYLCVLF